MLKLKSILALVSKIATGLVDGVDPGPRGLDSESPVQAVSLLLPVDGDCASRFPLSEKVVAALRKRLKTLRHRGKEFFSDHVDANVAKAFEQLRMVEMFLRDMGMRDSLSDETREPFLVRLSLYNIVDRGESYMKWKFTHISCLCLQQTEFPARPDWTDLDDRPDVLLGGVCFRYVRRMIHEGDYRFGWNLSQLKKGMPLVSDEAAKDQLAKTVKALSTDQRNGVKLPEDWGMGDAHANWDGVDIMATQVDIRFCTQQLIATCERAVDEFFPRGWYKPQQLFVPSISGHFFTKRADYGALGALVNNRDNQDFEHVLEHTYLPPHCFSAIKGALRVPEELMDTCLGPARFCGCCGWHPSDTTIYSFPTPEVSNIITDSVEYDEAHAHCRLNAVRPVELKEPFKVRVITGGPEGRYYRSKYIQKSVHSHLRRHPTCRLIGETLTAEALDTLPSLGPGEYYVSGDYSAATDNLDPLLSEAIARRISRNAGWDTAWEELFLKTLTGHRILDSKKKVQDNDEFLLKNSVDQRWGQLMGSPTSFPVLCIANVALTRYSQELRKKRQIKLSECGILINGDDIGFVTDDEGYDLWKRVTALGGLSPSMGKNFRSKHFIVLNSTFHSCVMKDEGPEHARVSTRHWEYLPYVNYGLLNCRNENGTPIQDLANALVPSGDPRTPDIGALAHDLVRGHPPEVQVDLLKRFIAAWKPSLNRFLPYGMSYYAPKHLGGLGLPIVGEFHATDGKERFSRCQRVLASFLSHDHERSSELTGTSVLGRSESLSLWKVIKPVVDKLMRKVPYEWTKEPKVGHQGCLTGNMLAGAYACLGSDDLEKADAEEDENRYLQWKEQYEALFRHARTTTFLPMSDEDMMTDLPWRKKYDDYTVVDFNPKVDLRKPPTTLSANWLNPSITHVTERVPDVEMDRDC